MLSLRVVTRPFTKVFIVKSPVGKQKQQQKKTKQNKTRNKQTNKNKTKKQNKTKNKTTQNKTNCFSLTACAKLLAFLLH